MYLVRTSHELRTNSTRTQHELNKTKKILNTMNAVILRGNVGQDPKITTFKDGGKVAQFSLATTERGYKTKEGKEIPDVTDWHNIVVKRTGLAEVCEKYVKKGSPLLVVGKIRTREYQDNGGQTRYVTEIIVEDMELLGGGKKSETAPAPEPDDYKPATDYNPLMTDDLPEGI